MDDTVKSFEYNPWDMFPTVHDGLTPGLLRALDEPGWSVWPINRVRLYYVKWVVGRKYVRFRIMIGGVPYPDPHPHRWACEN